MISFQDSVEELPIKLYLILFRQSTIRCEFCQKIQIAQDIQRVQGVERHSPLVQDIYLSSSWGQSRSSILCATLQIRLYREMKQRIIESLINLERNQALPRRRSQRVTGISKRLRLLKETNRENFKDNFFGRFPKGFIYGLLGQRSFRVKVLRIPGAC